MAVQNYSAQFDSFHDIPLMLLLLLLFVVISLLFQMLTDLGYREANVLFVCLYICSTLVSTIV